MLTRRTIGKTVVVLSRQRWSQRWLSSSCRYEEKRKEAEPRLGELAEVQQRDAMRKWLEELNVSAKTGQDSSKLPSLSKAEAETVIRAGFATFLLHVETRIASYIGEAFYTIGPCGEELMGVLGALARESDPMALHYRHLAVQLARQLTHSVAKGEKTFDQMILDRARGPVCSMLDPVTGGHHCAIGGGPYDFYVTSTLASQAPPAVGRAMGIKLAPLLIEDKDKLRFPKNAVSIVSVGDGSVNNAMFLSACNLAKYAQHRNFKCPVLFVISNNDICISLRGYGYLNTFLSSLGLPVFRASGGNGDVLTLWNTCKSALDSVRASSKPAVLVVDELPRRFGHAATDRQNMYLSEQEIQFAAEMDPMRAACIQMLEHGLIQSKDQLLQMWDETQRTVESSFIRASQEPKLSSREQVIARTKPPLAPLPSSFGPVQIKGQSDKDKRRLTRKAQPMRVHMNQVFKEIMSREPRCVYIGEDVRHGGYYRVTDDLAEMFPQRIQDVPPDETSVVGIGMGYSQNRLIPIVEIPYAKYLDCAADLFFESIMTHWCTSGAQKDGMVIRLQGFDKGVFGGNFHTHNMLNLPPGLDVVCYSNGRDYVRGMRHAVHQAQNAGRVVMSVDSTNLLYRRGLFEEDPEDTFWLHPYPFDDQPEDANVAMLDFETVVCYPSAANPAEHVYVSERYPGAVDNLGSPQVILFTYGNGVPTCLRAVNKIEQPCSALVVDCPTLGVVSQGMKSVLDKYPTAKLVFADVCKGGQHPMGAVIYKLERDGLLKGRTWTCVAAPETYNPLGCTLTFLNEEDVLEGISRAFQ